MPRNTHYKRICKFVHSGEKADESTSLAYHFFRSPCEYTNFFKEFVTTYYDDYCDRVKKIFGWKSPMIRRTAIGTKNQAQMFIICYDQKSTAEINDWFPYTIVDDESAVDESADFENKKNKKFYFDSAGVRHLQLNAEKSRFTMFQRYSECCGFHFNKMEKIRGPFILIKARMETLDRTKLLDKSDLCTCEPCVDKNWVDWYGRCPFYNLNDTKLMYCRNRYLLRDILAKARSEQTPEHIFNAKNSFSQTRSARNMSIEHGCRDLNCVACKKLQDSMKTQTEKLKNSYRAVKTGDSHAGDGDSILPVAQTLDMVMQSRKPIVEKSLSMTIQMKKLINGIKVDIPFKQPPVSYETNLLPEVFAEKIEEKSLKQCEVDEDKQLMETVPNFDV